MSVVFDGDQRQGQHDGLSRWGRRAWADLHSDTAKLTRCLDRQAIVAKDPVPRELVDYVEPELSKTESRGIPAAAKRGSR